MSERHVARHVSAGVRDRSSGHRRHERPHWREADASFVPVDAPLWRIDILDPFSRRAHMTHPFRTSLAALALIACAWLPGIASA